VEKYKNQHLSVDKLSSALFQDRGSNSFYFSSASFSAIASSIHVCRVIFTVLLARALEMASTVACGKFIRTNFLGFGGILTSRSTLPPY